MDKDTKRNEQIFVCPQLPPPIGYGGMAPLTYLYENKETSISNNFCSVDFVYKRNSFCSVQF